MLCLSRNIGQKVRVKIVGGPSLEILVVDFRKYQGLQKGVTLGFDDPDHNYEITRDDAKNRPDEPQYAEEIPGDLGSAIRLLHEVEKAAVRGSMPSGNVLLAIDRLLQSYPREPKD